MAKGYLVEIPGLVPVIAKAGPARHQFKGWLKVKLTPYPLSLLPEY